jgi:hypothetical protein
MGINLIDHLCRHVDVLTPVGGWRLLTPDDVFEHPLIRELFTEEDGK